MRELNAEEYAEYATKYPQVLTAAALLRQNGMPDYGTSLSADQATAILASNRRDAEAEEALAAVARAGGRLLTSKLAYRVEDFRAHYVTLPTGKGLGEHVPGETPIWMAALSGSLGQNKVNDCWRLMIDAAGDFGRDSWKAAAMSAAHVGTFAGHGPEDPSKTRVTLSEAEAMLDWPIIRSAIEAGLTPDSAR